MGCCVLGSGSLALYLHKSGVSHQQRQKCLRTSSGEGQISGDWHHGVTPVEGGLPIFIMITNAFSLYPTISSDAILTCKCTPAQVERRV